MLRLLLPIFILVAAPLSAFSQEEEKETHPLEGTWEAKSMIADGKSAPQDAIDLMRFRFVGEKLFLRGNSPTDKEEECAFKIDASQLPAHLEFKMESEKNPILGIYEFKGDALRICVRHASSDKGRPTEFESPESSKPVLIVFTKMAVE